MADLDALRLDRLGDHPQRPPLSPQSPDLVDRLLLGLVRDKLAVVATPEAERNGAAEIAAGPPVAMPASRKSRSSTAPAYAGIPWTGSQNFSVVPSGMVP